MFRIGSEEAEAASRVIQSGSLFRVNSERAEVSHFEEEFSARMGTAHTLLLNGGTGALAAAMVAIGVGPGDEVIVPAYTFIATPIAVLMTGAVPVIAEVDETLTLDPEDVRRKVSSHTRAILPVHIQGFPCAMDKIMETAREYDLRVVEDACQSCGGSFKGQPLGSIGDCAAFSFNAFKIITAGEGGAFVTKRADYYRRAILYHDCGAAFWSSEAVAGTIPFAGANLRASEIVGAILRVQLGRLDGILADLRQVKRSLIEKISASGAFTGCFVPSHDADGDCGVTLAMRFAEAETARRVAERIQGTRPFDTARHVYTHWDAVLNKRGAGTEFQNPYRLPENQGLQTDYTLDMCPKTLDYLSRTVYLPLNCDWSEEEIEQKAEKIIVSVQ